MPHEGPGFSGALRRALWPQPLRRALSAKIDSALPCPSLSTHALAPSRALAGPTARVAAGTYLLTTYSLTHLQLGDRPCRSKTFNATLGVASRSRQLQVDLRGTHHQGKSTKPSTVPPSSLPRPARPSWPSLRWRRTDGTPSAVELALQRSGGRRESVFSRAALRKGPTILPSSAPCELYHPPRRADQSCCCRTLSAVEIVDATDGECPS